MSTTPTSTPSEAIEMAVDGQHSIGSKSSATQALDANRKKKKRRSVHLDNPTPVSLSPSASASGTTRISPSNPPPSSPNEESDLLSDFSVTALLGGEEEEESESESTSNNLDEAETPTFITPSTFVATAMWKRRKPEFNSNLMDLMRCLSKFSRDDIRTLSNNLVKSGNFVEFGDCDAQWAESHHHLMLTELVKHLQGAKRKTEIIVSPYRLLELLFRSYPAKMSVTTAPFDYLIGKSSFRSVLGGDFLDNNRDPRNGKWPPRKLSKLAELISLELRCDVTILPIPLCEYRSLLTILTTVSIRSDGKVIKINEQPPKSRLFITGKDGDLIHYRTVQRCQDAINTLDDTPVVNAPLATYDLVGYCWKYTSVAKHLPSPLPLPTLSLPDFSPATIETVCKNYATLYTKITVDQTTARQVRSRLDKLIPEYDYDTGIGFLTRNVRKRYVVSRFKPDAAVTTQKLGIPKCPIEATGNTLYCQPSWSGNVSTDSLDEFFDSLGKRVFTNLIIYVPILANGKVITKFAAKLYAYSIARGYKSLQVSETGQSHSPHAVIILSTAAPAGGGYDALSASVPIGTKAILMGRVLLIAFSKLLLVVKHAELNYMKACQAGLPYPWRKFAFIEITASHKKKKKTASEKLFEAS